MLIFNSDEDIKTYLFVYNDERYGIDKWTEYDLYRWMREHADFIGILCFWIDGDGNIIILRRERSKPTWRENPKDDDLRADGCENVTFQIRDIGWGELLITRSSERGLKHYMVPKKGRWKGWMPQHRRFPENQKFA